MEPLRGYDVWKTTEPDDPYQYDEAEVDAQLAKAKFECGDPMTSMECPF